MSVCSYLLNFLGIGYWFFRIYVALSFQGEGSFVVEPINFNMEIAVLFLTIPCIVFVFKRNIIGAACYLAIYVSYFGVELYSRASYIYTSGGSFFADANFLALFAGVLIPFLTFIDVLFNKNRAGGSKETKTNWFYNNSEYDRKLDERADKNQYKF